MPRVGRLVLVERLGGSETHEAWFAIDEAAGKSFVIAEVERGTQRVEITMQLDRREMPPTVARALDVATRYPERSLPTEAAVWLASRYSVSIVRGAIPPAATSPTHPDTEPVLSRVIPALTTEPRLETAATVPAMQDQKPIGIAEILETVSEPPPIASGTLSSPERTGLRAHVAMPEATLSAPQRTGIRDRVDRETVDDTASRSSPPAIHDPADDARAPSIVARQAISTQSLESRGTVGTALTYVAAFLLLATGTVLLAIAARDYLRGERDPLPAPTTRKTAAPPPALREVEHPATWAIHVPKPQAPLPPGKRGQHRKTKASVEERVVPEVVEPAPPPPPPVLKAGIGRVNIVVRQTGRSIPLLVYIDGRPVDQAPLQLDLASGTHDIEVRPEKAAPVARKVTVKADETLRVVLDL